MDVTFWGVILIVIMALIKKGKGRKDGGYSRLFGNIELGHLISRVQSAVISAGTELEQIIKKEVTLIDNLDTFLKKDIMPDGIFVADKRKMKNCKALDFSGSEPDFIIFKRRNKQQKCHLIELKDGDSFDTKKSAAEHQAMHLFISKNAQHLPFIVKSHFCCFNQNDKTEILKGFKNKISKEEAMTGKEFCELLEIDYNAIVKKRNKDASKNLEYFLSEITKIEVVKNWLKKFFSQY